MCGRVLLGPALVIGQFYWAEVKTVLPEADPHGHAGSARAISDHRGTLRGGGEPATEGAS